MSFGKEILMEQLDKYIGKNILKVADMKIMVNCVCILKLPGCVKGLNKAKIGKGNLFNLSNTLQIISCPKFLLVSPEI